MPQNLLVLSRNEVEEVCSDELAYEAASAALVAQAAGAADVAERTRLVVTPPDEDLLVMPGYVRWRQILGVKLIAGFPGNPARGLHVSPATIVLMNPETGLTEALLDATHLTDQRTAAVTALACRHLARPDSRVLALVGTGALARAHVTALARILPLEEIRVWSRSPSNVAAFVEQIGPRTEVPMRGASSLEECVEAADVVVTATTAMRPVVLAEHVAEGATVCGVGSYLPGAAELHSAVVGAADVVAVDSKPAVLGGPADIAAPVAAGSLDVDAVAELGAIVAGDRPGRTANGQRTVFKGVGSAAVDLVAAAMVVQAARERGLGREMPPIEVVR